jgi:hypothetical protein
MVGPDLSVVSICGDQQAGVVEDGHVGPIGERGPTGERNSSVTRS